MQKLRLLAVALALALAACTGPDASEVRRTGIRLTAGEIAATLATGAKIHWKGQSPAYVIFRPGGEAEMGNARAWVEGAWRLDGDRLCASFTGATGNGDWGCSEVYRSGAVFYLFHDDEFYRKLWP